jgi:hypothetical protein
MDIPLKKISLAMAPISKQLIRNISHPDFFLNFCRTFQITSNIPSVLSSFNNTKITPQEGIF